MKREKLKLILDSLVMKEERDYTIRVRNRKTRRRAATYFAERGEIVIYRGVRSWRKLFCYSIHELAHHLCQKQGVKVWHGKVFTHTLTQLLKQFNLVYGDTLKGNIVFDRRSPRQAPKWRNRRKVNTTGINSRREKRG